MITELLCVEERKMFFTPPLTIMSPQIFYDLVRQINRKTPVEKKKAKKKSNCVLL